MTTRLFIILNNANKMTTKPADLKNMPDLELFCMPKELNDKSARTGSVPSANDSIVIAPVIKLPVDNV